MTALLGASDVISENFGNHDCKGRGLSKMLDGVGLYVRGCVMET